MGVYLNMINLDEVFASLDVTPVVVNDYNTSIPAQKEMLDKHLHTHYKDTDTIESAARCDCGNPDLTDVHDIGTICPKCQTPVESTTSQPFRSMLWIRAPEGVRAMVAPEAYSVLEPVFRAGKDFNFLDYLLGVTPWIDDERLVSKETLRRMAKFKKGGFERGLNYFIDNFDEIMRFMFAENIVDPSKANKDELWQFIQENKQHFFPQYIPVPSRICFVVESTTSGVYIDKPLGLAMDAVQTIASIREGVRIRPSDIQKRAVKASLELAEFHDTYTKDRLSQKPGVFRRHIFGSRLHYSARGVISSISDPHDYDEIHIPWGMGVQLFKYHIINKLLKRGYSENQALEFVYCNVLKYNVLMDQIFQELIAEAPGGRGPSAQLQRNPTLQRGSTQQFVISRIKTNIRDNTIGMSALCLRAPNAD